MSDKSFSEVLRKAIGSKTIKEFSALSKIGSATLSELMKNKYEPSDSVMERLAIAEEFFENNLTMKDLEEARKNKAYLTVREIESFVVGSITNELENLKGKKFVGLSHLNNVNKAKNFDFSYSFDKYYKENEFPFLNWYFEVKNVILDKYKIKELFLGTIKSELFKCDIKDNKYSLVICDPEAFGYIVNNIKTMNLNLNYSVILIDYDHRSKMCSIYEHILCQSDPCNKGILIGKEA